MIFYLYYAILIFTDFPLINLGVLSEVESLSAKELDDVFCVPVIDTTTP
jgi:hypothetical protein